jgi:transcriptional regulator with XRE-family HTH domain
MYIIISPMKKNNEAAKENLGELLRLQRATMRLTLHELSAVSGVSPSHLGRIEKGNRFPSAHVLQRIAKPLGFDEDELFTLAGYLSSGTAVVVEKAVARPAGRLDPYVAKMLGQESPEVQHAVIGLLTILKNVARGMPRRASDYSQPPELGE